jgi:branched-chain amino acid transport system substrate-binding protein
MQMRLLLLSIALVTFSIFANARAADDRVKIGVLTDMNGPYAALTGKGSVAAAELAIEDFGGKVLGEPVELVVADHMQKPDIGASIARKWYDNEGVDAIFDGAGSSVALAILEIARTRNKIVAFSGVISPDVTGKLCAETISSWAWDTHAMVATSIKSLMKSGGKRFFFLTLDAAAGRALEADATKIIEANGGAVIGSVRHPINIADFSSFLLQAQGAKPDVIVLANAGADTINSLKQAAEFGLTSGSNAIKVAGLLAMINDIEALGLEFAHGVVVSESFYWDMNDATRAWTKRFKERTGGIPPNMLQAAVYSSVLHYLKAVARTGATEGILVAAAMKDTLINDMYSKDVRLRADGRAVRDFHLFEVKSRSESKGSWDDYKLLETVPGDEAFPASSNACHLLK